MAENVTRELRGLFDNYLPSWQTQCGGNPSVNEILDTIDETTQVRLYSISIGQDDSGADVIYSGDIGADINAAITTLGGAGNVLILDGSYTLVTPIDLVDKQGILISGLSSKQTIITSNALAVPIIDAQHTAPMYNNIIRGITFDNTTAAAGSIGIAMNDANSTKIFDVDFGNVESVLYIGDNTSGRFQHSLFLDSKVVDVREFGAMGDGVHDDTDAIQKAIRSGANAVYLSGEHLVTSITVDVPNIKIFGDSYSSKLISSDNVSDVLDITNACEALYIEKIMFTNEGDVQRTGGTYIANSANEIYIQECKFYKGFKAIDIDNNASIIHIDKCHFRNFDTSGLSDVIRLDSANGAILVSDIVMDNDSGAMPLSGIRVKAAGDIIIDNCNIIHCGNDLMVDPDLGVVVASLWANNTFFDTAERGVYMHNNNGGSIVRARFTSCWASSHTQQGILIDKGDPINGTINGVTFIDMHCILNGPGASNNGMTINKAFNVTILGGLYAQNGQAGISITQNTTNIYIFDVLSGAFSGLTGNQYGIYIDTGCTSIVLIDNRFAGNTVTDVSHNSPGGASNIYKGNIGFRTRSKGTATITNPATTVVVNHTLGVTPALEEIQIHRTNAASNSGEFWVSNATSTQFTINVTTTPTTSCNFGWQCNAEIRGY